MFANEKTLSLMSFIIGQYFFVLSFIFYTPLLSIIAPKEKRGKVSGYGMAGNFLGNISALFLALPFATGKISLFNMEPHAETLFPLLVAFFVFALPMILFFREPNRQVKKIPVQNLDLLFKQMKFLFSNKNVLLFFLSFILLNGAILTFSNNFPIVLSNLWQAPDTVKTFILLAIVIVSVLGSIVSGYLVDFWGGKKVLIHITIGWIIIMPILALMFSFSYFVATIIIAGFLLGANMTSSRVLMSNLVDFRQHNLAFAFFTIAERTSVIVAPILWGLIATDLTVLGPWRYRLAILSMVLLIALSLPFLLKVKDAYKS
ncbi:MAG: MFS transporter [Candidatus Paceibacterota bacterium]